MKKYFLLCVGFILCISFCYTEELILQDSFGKETSEDSPVENTENEKVVKPVSFFENGRTKFAIGFETSGMLGNSCFPLNNFFKPTLEIDLNDVVNRLHSSNYALASMAHFKFFIDIYLKAKYEFGLFLDADVVGFGMIPKDLISIAAHGNAGRDRIQGDMNDIAYGNIFASIGLFYGMKINNNFNFRVSSAYFVPLAHIDYYVGDYEFTTEPETGRILLKGSFDFNIYSPLPIFPGNSKLNTNELFSGGGLDVTFQGTYIFPPFANLNFAVQNIPLLPARMSTGISQAYKGSFEVEALTTYFNSLFSDSTEQTLSTKGEFTGSSSYGNLRKKYVFRPLKIAVSSNIYPLKNEYLIIIPNIGLHCLKPVYVDAGLRLESHFAKVLGLYYSLSREDRVWKNRIGLFVDARVFRLETKVSTASPLFTGSFRTTGLQLDLSMVFGY